MGAEGGLTDAPWKWVRVARAGLVRACHHRFELLPNAGLRTGVVPRSHAAPAACMYSLTVAA